MTLSLDSLRVASLIVCVLSCSSVEAYTEAVHFRFSTAAFDSSILVDSGGPLRSLGIEDALATRFTTVPSQGVEPRLVSAKNLVAWGAYYEDNPLTEGRFLRHFLDPQQENQ